MCSSKVKFGDKELVCESKHKIMGVPVAAHYVFTTDDTGKIVNISWVEDMYENGND